MGDTVEDELPRALLRNVLAKWRDDLIDLTGRNRLLNFRHTRTATLAIRSPQADPLLTALDSGLRFAELPEDDAENEGLTTLDSTDGIVTQKTTKRALEAALRKLYRDSNQMFNDTGLWTLQLGVAFLKWREPGAESFNHAPLLLVPVRLDRLGPGLFKLVEEESEDVVPNPALAVKMGQLGLDWPDPDNMKDLPSALSSVRAAIANHQDWEVSEEVVLATFPSRRRRCTGTCWPRGQIIAHPLVRALGRPGPDYPGRGAAVRAHPRRRGIDRDAPPGEDAAGPGRGLLPAGLRRGGARRSQFRHGRPARHG